MFYYLFVILIVIASLLMIGIVLIQESKGGGLSSNFSAGNQLAGVRKTTDFIEKATWGLAIAMVVLSVLCAYFAPTAMTEQSAVEATTTNPLTNPTTQQNFGVTPQAAEGQAAPAQGQAAPAQGQAAPAADAAPAAAAAPAADAQK
jgi:preprotein translocase subunit SecG